MQFNSPQKDEKILDSRNSECSKHGEYFETLLDFPSGKKEWTGCPICYQHQKRMEAYRIIAEEMKQKNIKLVNGKWNYDEDGARDQINNPPSFYEKD